MRKRIIAGRGTGKTKELMHEALANNGIFVCQNARHMKEKALAYGFNNLKRLQRPRWRTILYRRD